MSNTLYTNDNLFILNGLNSQSVDLIYLDPPFNTKRLYSAPVGSKAAGTSFKDMWTWADINEAYLDTLATQYSPVIKFITSVGNVHSKAMAAYLTYMAQRLTQMHRILKDTGSLCFHCDPTASHYVKMLLDMVFGRRNFRNEIVWCYRRWTANANKFQSMHDIILFYAKNADTNHPKFNKLLFDTTESGQKKVNRGYQTNTVKDGDSRISQLIVYDKDKAAPLINSQKYDRIVYREGQTEIVLPDWWEIPIINSQSKERTGYPTQKPLALLNRIISALSDKDDLVLDPFCGCATTCVAAEHLGRKWIGIDVEKNAVSLLKDRLTDASGIFKDFIATDKIPVRTDVLPESPNKKSIKERLYKEQNGKCNGCGVSFELRNLVTDHIVPVHHGGGSYYENYQLLCGHCNSTKGARPMEYLMKKVAIRTAELEKEVFFSDREWGDSRGLPHAKTPSAFSLND